MSHSLRFALLSIVLAAVRTAGAACPAPYFGTPCAGTCVPAGLPNVACAVGYGGGAATGSNLFASTAAGALDAWGDINGTKFCCNIGGTAGGQLQALSGALDDTMDFSAMGSGMTSNVLMYDGDDTFIGCDQADQVGGGLGNDTIYGNDGNDIVNGSDDNDEIWGDEGDDWLEGGLQDDDLFGGPGADDIAGDVAGIGGSVNDGEDNIRGDEGNDILVGGGKADNICGNENNDAIYGVGGDDYLLGGVGTNTIDGGAHIAGDTCYNIAGGGALVNCEFGVPVGTLCPL